MDIRRTQGDCARQFNIYRTELAYFERIATELQYRAGELEWAHPLFT
jgi:hypothetical protein